MGESGRNPSQYGRERRERRGVYFRAGRAGSPDGGQGWESDHGNADSFGNHLTNAFSAICCLQKSRFTASKPSIFAIASDEKFIRHLVTSFHQRSLSQSQYQNDPTKPNFGTLTATTYGNGAKISSRYDDFNRVTGVVYGEETAPRYEYDYNAKGQVARVRDNLLNRTTQSEYDLANRPVRVKTSEDAKHVYTGQVAYDNVYGNLSEFTEKVGENRQEFGTKFGYDDENRPTSLTYSASGKEIGQSTTTIDKLNRTTFSAVKLGSKTFTSEYHFAAGGYGTGSVTNLVASITQPGCNCGYGYDDNGNIASATLNGKWTGYTYDALGQLVQVNDHSDTRSGASGTTWKYTYDLGGNILKKERFAYADTTNPLETVTYTYGDANWRDKLTAVNGNAIAYDAIGNPLNDGTWTYTWQNGRQLQKMQKAGVTAEFVYNADGLRVQKTVNGVATKYTLHGKNVVHMTSGTDELHFFYDAQNRPAVVVYNGTAYAYVKSLQGDIVAILDENGNAVVSYGYDAWGAPLWCTGELAETLGKVQPFRYRGYVFDEETGLYYLRSRYYNAERCRFVNADALLKGGLYCYCFNEPVYRKDSCGFDWDQSDFDFEANSDYFKTYVRPRIYSFLRKAVDYRYPGKNPKYHKKDVDNNVGYIPATYSSNGKLNRQGVIDCSHYNYECTGVGHTTAPKRYDEVPDKYKGALYDEDGNYTVQLCEGMEVYSEDFGHTGMLIWENIGFGYEWCVAQSTSETITRFHVYFEDDKHKGPNITSLEPISGDRNWFHYTAPRYMIDENGD